MKPAARRQNRGVAGKDNQRPDPGRHGRGLPLFASVLPVARALLFLDIQGPKFGALLGRGRDVHVFAALQIVLAGRMTVAVRVGADALVVALAGSGRGRCYEGGESREADSGNKKSAHRDLLVMVQLWKTSTDLIAACVRLRRRDL